MDHKSRLRGVVESRCCLESLSDESPFANYRKHVLISIRSPSALLKILVVRAFRLEELPLSHHALCHQVEVRGEGDSPLHLALRTLTYCCLP